MEALKLERCFFVLVFFGCLFVFRGGCLFWFCLGFVLGCLFGLLFCLGGKGLKKRVFLVFFGFVCCALGSVSR